MKLNNIDLQLYQTQQSSIIDKTFFTGSSQCVASKFLRSLL